MTDLLSLHFADIRLGHGVASSLVKNTTPGVLSLKTSASKLGPALPAQFFLQAQVVFQQEQPLIQISATLETEFLGTSSLWVDPTFQACGVSAVDFLYRGRGGLVLESGVTPFCGGKIFGHDLVFGKENLLFRKPFKVTDHHQCHTHLKLLPGEGRNRFYASPPGRPDGAGLYALGARRTDPLEKMGPVFFYVFFRDDVTAGVLETWESIAAGGNMDFVFLDTPTAAESKTVGESLVQGAASVSLQHPETKALISYRSQGFVYEGGCKDIVSILFERAFI